MPWIDKEECTNCGECIEQCPVNTIFLVGDITEIDMDNCIRCGICHGVCPVDAIKHDSKKVPEKVNANIETTKRCMEACAHHLGGEEEKQKCLYRMIKHFNNEKIIAEKTLESLEMMRE
ncbi:MAG: 4Fe-4S binding protein [Thermodesulfobacteriota bacterium]